MRSRPYYSVGTGKNPLAKSFDLSSFRDVFKNFYVDLDNKGYFQQALGFVCVDTGFLPGTLGDDLPAVALRKLRRLKLLPVLEHVDKYSEDDLFDVIEFLYDHCSQPLKKDGFYHSFSGCGWHYKRFRREPGRQLYRQEVDQVLADYDGGYELSVEGEILALPEKGFERLVAANLPAVDPGNVNERVATACLKFRRYRSTIDDRKDAIRDLADVLEYLRPKLKKVLTKKDESDLFQIANGFGIRHHNDDQKTDYDKPIWYSWIFYYYLATIHACGRLIEKAEQGSRRQTDSSVMASE